MRLRNREIIVHLGNADFGVGCGRDESAHYAEIRTARIARALPRVQVIGIDVAPFDRKKFYPELRNWTQIEADFVTGLGTLKDGSAALITSDIAVGHYNNPHVSETVKAAFRDRYTVMEDAHTLHTLMAGYRKLAQSGKMILSVGGRERMKKIVNKMVKAGFKEVKVSRMNEKERVLSYWLRNYAATIYKITARK